MKKVEKITKKNAALEAQRAYKREWYKKNKERVAEYNKQYWLKKGQELLEKQKMEDNP